MSTDRAERVAEVVLVSSIPSAGNLTPSRSWRVYVQVAALAVVVLVIVGVAGAYAARSEAEQEGARATARRVEILADVVITPALRNGIRDRTPGATRTLDAAVRQYVLGPATVRVKLSAPDGTLLYSNDPQSVGQRFDLGESARAVLAGRATAPVVADPDLPENATEANLGKLLEVTTRVRTPDGSPALLQVYAPYDLVSARTEPLWRGFTSITLISLVALLLLLLPVVWRLLRRLRQQTEQREHLLQGALDASDAERRRIAATLHDGVVQELAATSFAVSGAAGHATRAGDDDLALALEEASTAVRAGIRGLRDLLVDIYPAGLHDDRLVPTLEDVIGGLARGPSGSEGTVSTRLLADPGAADSLSTAQSELVFRVAQECLRNAVRHAGASLVEVSLRLEERQVVLEVSDDGSGFDLDQVLERPARGHFGVRLLTDAARQAGAGLAVRTAPGQGTRWRLAVPTG